MMEENIKYREKAIRLVVQKEKMTGSSEGGEGAAGHSLSVEGGIASLKMTAYHSSCESLRFVCVINKLTVLLSASFPLR